MSIKCHSAFVHYNMFHNNHCHGGGNNFGSIFNITNNCNGGHTNFWGGFGAGLGMGFGNLFGGLLGNFMGGFGMGGFGGFGGFGMGGFGFGMPGMFGGFGGGLSSLWGGGADKGSLDYDSDYSPRRSRRSSCDCGCESKKEADEVKKEEKTEKVGKEPETKPETKPAEVDYTDADCKKIADFQKRINELTNPTDETEVTKLKSDIEEAKKACENDPKNKDANLESYKQLLTSLENKTSAPVAEVVNTPKTAVKIGGKDINIGDIKSANDLVGLTFAEAGKINAADAKKILENAGFIKGGVGKMTLNPAILKLFETSEVPVKCAQNQESTDKYVLGKVKNVAVDESDSTKLASYDINCKGASGALFEYLWSFKASADVDGKKAFRLADIDKNGSSKEGYIASDWNTRDYIWDDNQAFLVITGEPQVSEHSGGRKKLESKASDISFSS